MSLHIDGQQVWIFIPKQLAMIFFIFLPQPFILKQDDFVKLHSNGPDSILNVSGAPKTRITKLGDMVISSISVSTHVVKSLTIKQLYFFKLSWAWQVMRGLILSGLDCTWYDMIQKSDLLSLVSTCNAWASVFDKLIEWLNLFPIFSIRFTLGSL